MVEFICWNSDGWMDFVFRSLQMSNKEIRETAQKMLDLVQNIEYNPFKHTLEAINVRIQSES